MVELRHSEQACRKFLKLLLQFRISNRRERQKIKSSVSGFTQDCLEFCSNIPTVDDFTIILKTFAARRIQPEEVGGVVCCIAEAWIFAKRFRIDALRASVIDSLLEQRTNFRNVDCYEYFNSWEIPLGGVALIRETLADEYGLEVLNRLSFEMPPNKEAEISPESWSEENRRRNCLRNMSCRHGTSRRIYGATIIGLLFEIVEDEEEWINSRLRAWNALVLAVNCVGKWRNRIEAITQTDRAWALYRIGELG